MKQGFCPTHDELIQEIAAVFGISAPEFLALSARRRKGDGRIEVGGTLPGGISTLRGRSSELTALSNYWKDRSVRFVCIDGETGAGKTSLVSHWLDRLIRRHHEMPSVTLRVLKFSFNGPENTAVPGSSSAFFGKAYEWLRLVEANETPEHKGHRVAEAIVQADTLLVLDGIEQLQFPPKHDKHEEVSDNGLRSLIRRLQELPSSFRILCVLTSRMSIKDLRPFEGQEARRRILPPLEEEAGAAIFAEYGIQARRNDLDQIMAAVKGHPFTLHLLGGCLRDQFRGDARRWRECLLQKETDHGKIVQHIMASYEKWFDRPTLQLLRILGLFQGPAPWRTVKELLAQEPIPHLTDGLVGLSHAQLSRMLVELKRSHFLSFRQGSIGDHLDVHPLIQEHFREFLRNRFCRAWRLGNERLFQLYLHSSSSEIQNRLDAWRLYSAIIHACNAGLYREAFRLYWKRSDHGSGQSVARRLSLYADDLFALRSFFRDGNWRQAPPQLKQWESCFLWTQMGTRMRWVGLLGESCDVMEHVIQRWKKLVRH